MAPHKIVRCCADVNVQPELMELFFFIIEEFLHPE